MRKFWRRIGRLEKKRYLPLEFSLHDICAGVVRVERGQDVAISYIRRSDARRGKRFYNRAICLALLIMMAEIIGVTIFT